MSSSTCPRGKCLKNLSVEACPYCTQAAMWGPCKGHGVGCLWLLLLKPTTGSDKRYENHRHKFLCHFRWKAPAEYCIHQIGALIAENTSAVLHMFHTIAYKTDFWDRLMTLKQQGRLIWGRKYSEDEARTPSLHVISCLFGNWFHVPKSYIPYILAYKSSFWE